MHTIFESMKIVAVCQPQLKDNGAATVTYCDTKGFNHATFILNAGTIDAVLDAKLTECDTYNGQYADIAGAAITQIAANGDDRIVAIEVKLTGRKRFLQPVITSGDGVNGALVAANIILSRAEASPANAAAAGLAELLKV